MGPKECRSSDLVFVFVAMVTDERALHNSMVRQRGLSLRRSKQAFTSGKPSISSVAGVVILSGYYFCTSRPDVLLVGIGALPITGDFLRYTISPLLKWLLVPVVKHGLFSPGASRCAASGTVTDADAVTGIDAARECYALLNRGKGRKRLLFLKKKKQKDFYESALSLSGEAETKQIKVFWFFSSEKNIAFFA